MSKTFPLQILINLAKEQMDNAIIKLGQLNRQRQDIDAKLDLLLQYRQEYQLRFEESVRCGMNMGELQNYRYFLHKLDTAIAQQRQVQVEFVEIVRVGQVEYQERRKKLKSFETLAERHQALEDSKASRREQKELDDFSNKAFIRNLQEEE
ncbi:MAG: flagellar export protein FliJ [Burkholderiales bacterium]